jgi:isoleucyl-tRNA synthetase
VELADGEERYILAKDLVGQYYKSPEDHRVIREFRGADFVGVEYEPLFPYFASLAEKGAFRTFVGDHVSTEEGTGIVHTAPGFGEEDYALLRDTGIPVVCPIDDDCRFTSEVKDYEGLFVKDADKAIIRDLKAKGAIVKHATIVHSYPFCWRTDAPLIYRAVTSWFVAVEKIKPALLAANAQIRWMPAHLKDGRFGNWLEGARDWVISRNRYWGNPIPVWVCETCGEMVCIGSRRELEERSGRSVPDLHKHFVDEIAVPCRCGGTMRRIPEVLDCWFESGAMPYGQSHYPFENREWLDAHFPADFIAEGLDQTRGWFYTLTVLAAALFDKPAFRNVVVNGLVLDSDGKKMSKSKRNYTDPAALMSQFGADALRLFLLGSPVVKAEDLRYSDDGVREVVKNMLIPFWNSYSFYVTYANIDGVEPADPPAALTNPLDRWILSETERMVGEVGGELDAYDLQKALEPIARFVDLLTNWYIRRSRRRFWRSENDSDKLEAYQTLRYVLVRLSQAACPFIPFVTEEIYGNLRREGDPESVPLCDYPVRDGARLDSALERRMEVARHAVSMGRALRTAFALKTRQPLKALHLVTRDPEERRILEEMESIIREELNVKEVHFRDNEQDLVEYRAKANFRVLGKVLGKDMKEAAARIEELRGAELERLVRGERVTLQVGGRSLEVGPAEVSLDRIEKEQLKVLNEGSLTVGIDPELTEELVQEGLVRDLVRAIQNLRKDAGLNVTDRISVELHGSEALREAVEGFEEHWTEEVLAASWRWARAARAAEVVCGGERCWIAVAKV